MYPHRLCNTQVYFAAVKPPFQKSGLFVQVCTSLHKEILCDKTEKKVNILARNDIASNMSRVIYKLFVCVGT